MSVNLSELFPPSSSSGGGGGGEFVHIGANPPASPEEGQQWMEVPVSGDATMWIYDGNKWLQHPSGKDGAPGADGNIADATEDGVIATWDNTAGQWTPDSSVVVDADGNVGIGGVHIGGEPKTKLEIGDNTDDSPVLRLTDSRTVPQAGNFLGGIEFYQNRTGAVDSYIYSYFQNLTNTDLRFGTGGTERMRIDASGNVGIGTGSMDGAKFRVANPVNTLAMALGEHNLAARHLEIKSFGVSGYNGAGWDFNAKETTAGTITFSTGSRERMRIDASGKTTFVSGGQLDRGLSISGGTANGMADSAWTISADAQNSGSQIIFKTRGVECMKLGENGRVDITGSLYVNGTPKIGTAELIETLSTLREATKDETTIKGLRDAIGNAVGGLIEKFEAMQSPVTQEISNE